jgi:hypothetical protein
MATPRRRRAAQPPDEIELANIPPADVLADAVPPLTATDERRAQELEDIIDEIGSESRVRIWQIVDGKTSFAGEMGGADFTLDALLDAFGGGDKALAIYTGRTCVSRVRVSLDPSLPPKNPRLPKPVPGVPVTGPSPLADMSAVMTQMMTFQMQSAQSMNTMMTGIIGALTAVMTATKPAKDPTEIALEIAKAMKGNGGDDSRTLDMLKFGLDIGERIGGGRGEDDGVMSAVNKGLDTLGEVVRGIVEDRRAARALPQPVADVPAPTATQQQPTTEGAPVATGNDESVKGAIRPWVAAARPYIGQLFAAWRFMKPNAAAATIADNLDDDQFFDLLDDIQDPDGGGFGVRLREYFPKEVESVDPNWIGEVLSILLSEHVDVEEVPDAGQPAAPTQPEPPKAS